MTSAINIPDSEKTVTMRGVAIQVDCVLVRVADLRAKAKDWPAGADQWRVTLTVNGRTFATDYHTGTGLRARDPKRAYLEHRGKVTPGTVAWEENEALKCPVHPTARSVLSTLAGDVGTVLELPRDDGAAMDYLADQFGATGKPSEVLEMESVRRTRERGMRGIFIHQGVVPCLNLSPNIPPRVLIISRSPISPRWSGYYRRTLTGTR